MTSLASRNTKGKSNDLSSMLKRLLGLPDFYAVTMEDKSSHKEQEAKPFVPMEATEPPFIIVITGIIIAICSMIMIAAITIMIMIMIMIMIIMIII